MVSFMVNDGANDIGWYKLYKECEGHEVSIDLCNNFWMLMPYSQPGVSGKQLANQS
jgi:hypothetical protein